MESRLEGLQDDSRLLYSVTSSYVNVEICSFKDFVNERSSKAGKLIKHTIGLALLSSMAKKLKVI